MRILRVPLAILALVLPIRADTPDDVASAASAWLGSLDSDQRKAALYAFDDDERFDLRLAPLWLEGLRRDEMSEDQWQRWRVVLAAALGEAGLEKVESVMRLEHEVRARDRESWTGGWFGGFVHGEQRYFVSVFGEPRPGEPWGARFDGHHVSVNWTVGPRGRLSVGPFFLGGEPREVAKGREHAGLRVLAAEEDAGAALWEALDPERRALAELEFERAWGPAGGIRPLFVGEGERVDAPELRGIARAALDARQRERLDAIIETYLGNQPTQVAAAQREAIDAAGRDAIHFAWAGSLVPGEPGYYRVQGPTFLIEFDNTMPTADHVHTIFRALDGDFGRDLLAEHYSRDHGRAVADARHGAALPPEGPTYLQP